MSYMGAVRQGRSGLSGTDKGKNQERVSVEDDRKNKTVQSQSFLKRKHDEGSSKFSKFSSYAQLNYHRLLRQSTRPGSHAEMEPQITQASGQASDRTMEDHPPKQVRKALFTENLEVAVPDESKDITEGVIGGNICSEKSVLLQGPTMVATEVTTNLSSLKLIVDSTGMENGVIENGVSVQEKEAGIKNMLVEQESLFSDSDINAFLVDGTHGTEGLLDSCLTLETENMATGTDGVELMMEMTDQLDLEEESGLNAVEIHADKQVTMLDEATAGTEVIHESHSAKKKSTKTSIILKGADSKKRNVQLLTTRKNPAARSGMRIGDGMNTKNQAMKKDSLGGDKPPKPPAC